MTCKTGNHILAFDVFDHLSNKLNFALFHPLVADVAHDAHPNGAVVDGQIDVFPVVALFRIGRCQPLDFTASFPVGIQDLDLPRRRPQGCRIDAALLAYPECLHHLLIREILAQEIRHVDKVATVGKTADEIAAADQAAHVHPADTPLRNRFYKLAEIDRPGDTRRSPGDAFDPGSRKVLFFKTWPPVVAQPGKSKTTKKRK